MIHAPLTIANRAKGNLQRLPCCILHFFIIPHHLASVIAAPLIYMLAHTATPPNKAPNPTAAVLAGAAGLLVEPVPVADAAVPVPVAEFFNELTLALNELVRPPSSELRLLLTLPVAVASTELMELARLAASLVTLATSEDRSDKRLDTSEANGRVLVMLRPMSEVMSEAIEAAAEVTPPMAEEMPSTAEERPLPASEVAVWRMPPGSALTSVWVASAKSWADTSEAAKAARNVDGRIVNLW
ncbi:hypothetical protein BD289DRAFT_420449 [Coniella lustricola]|uniref:Uncharacterized protein n=1 Tax=Coniella lustricola TaxID=2025994 RepID=A0A2T3AN62_9PEZI|nr:hypothetical protein BD289DRAFT_420449 [Coniella lustricola]